jgi:hypothetical protein
MEYIRNYLEYCFENFILDSKEKNEPMDLITYQAYLMSKTKDKQFIQDFEADQKAHQKINKLEKSL